MFIQDVHLLYDAGHILVLKCADSIVRHGIHIPMIQDAFLDFFVKRLYFIDVYHCTKICSLCKVKEKLTLYQMIEHEIAHIAKISAITCPIYHL